MTGKAGVDHREPEVWLLTVNCWYDTHSSSSNMPFLIHSSSVWLTDVWDLTLHNMPHVYNEVPLSRHLMCGTEKEALKLTTRLGEHSTDI